VKQCDLVEGGAVGAAESKGQQVGKHNKCCKKNKSDLNKYCIIEHNAKKFNQPL
jgi:hypothetical protein